MFLVKDKVDIRIGSLVSHGNSVYRISHVAVIGINLESGLNVQLPVGELRPADAAVPDRDNQDDVSDEDWRTAEKRYEVIQPLVVTPPGRAVVEEHAKKANIDTATLYRWIKRYQTAGLPALVPRKRGWRTGRKRTDSAAATAL